MTKDIEDIAWDCSLWPKKLHEYVEDCMEVSDEMDMSTEQVVAFAILAERERCARKLEAMAATYLPGGPMDAKGGLSMGAAALRAS